MSSNSNSNCQSGHTTVTTAVRAEGVNTLGRNFSPGGATQWSYKQSHSGAKGGGPRRNRGLNIYGLTIAHTIQLAQIFYTIILCCLLLFVASLYK